MQNKSRQNPFLNSKRSTTNCRSNNTRSTRETALELSTSFRQLPILKEEEEEHKETNKKITPEIPPIVFTASSKASTTDARFRHVFKSRDSITPSWSERKVLTFCFFSTTFLHLPMTFKPNKWSLQNSTTLFHVFFMKKDKRTTPKKTNNTFWWFASFWRFLMLSIQWRETARPNTADSSPILPLWSHFRPNKRICDVKNVTNKTHTHNHFSTWEAKRTPSIPIHLQCDRLCAN